MNVPHDTARNNPKATYTSATLAPKMLINNTRLPGLIIGEEIRNDNVIPIGSPALVKPMKIGIDEHEQNGVTAPSNAPIMLALIPRKRPMILLLRSGGKYV